MQWVKVCLSKYVDFNGRARRAEYWWFALAIFAVMMAFWVLMVVLSLTTGRVNEFTGERGLGLGWIPAIVMWLIGLATFLPQLSVSVRRLHDIGKSGWFYLVSLIPFGSFVLLYWFVQDSQPGQNMYGANPKGGGGYAQPQYGQQFGGEPQFAQASQQFAEAPQQFGGQPQYDSQSQYGQAPQFGQAAQPYGHAMQEAPKQFGSYGPQG